MKKLFRKTLLIAPFFILLSCQPQASQKIITVSNSLDIARVEVIEVSYKELGFTEKEEALFPMVTQTNTGDTVLCQPIDKNNDEKDDYLLILSEIPANTKVDYSISMVESKADFDSKVFSRFVPERTDDYAWENNLVAFRTYGPTAQKMVEDSIKGGTLSSGMDCWLKKVDYPIINKWYKKNTSGAGSYHKDTGEGLDNFHVGSTRGCGGTGVFLNDTLYTSKNFTAYNTISNGPIRTEFTLDYADWAAGDLIISEQKKISLDLGSNFMNIIANISGTESVTVGLTLHENDGETEVDSLNNWFSYWQPHGDSELGTAIIINPKYYKSFTKVVSKEKDMSQLLIHLKVIDGKVEYKAGFAWKESGQASSKDEWEAFLNDASKKYKSPLIVELK